jgi:subfamily B ATP-binding cassette protein HlyB/CyaB
LCGIAAYYHVAADPVHLSRELALQDRQADENDIIRAAMLIGLKAKLLVKVTATRLATLPTPAIVRPKNGSFKCWAGRPLRALSSGRSDLAC